MARKSGILVVGTECRLDDGTLLARCEFPNPIAAACAFLKSKGLRNGDRIWVEGDDGMVGSQPVFCITDAGMQAVEAARQMQAKEPSEKRPRKKKPSKKKPTGTKKSTSRKKGSANAGRARASKGRKRP